MQQIVLNELQIEAIRKLVEEKRQALGFVGETPIANDIFSIIEKIGIVLLEYPIRTEHDSPAFSAALMYLTEGNEELAFIGLNTADYFDKQIFAIAHELYHYYTRTGSHISRVDQENTLIESMANRFAAELLLPESVLKSIVLNEFSSNTLKNVQIKKILRFIARMQCTWWLPYRSLVRRLSEINAISNVQYEELYNIDERNLEGYYGRIGQAISQEVFLKLNHRTNNISTSPKVIEIIIRNFEDGIIDEDNFVETLRLFNKKPSDYGCEYLIAEEDVEEFEDFLCREAEDED